MKYLPQYYTAAYLRRDPYDPGTDGGPYLVYHQLIGHICGRRILVGLDLVTQYST